MASGGSPGRDRTEQRRMACSTFGASERGELFLGGRGLPAAPTPQSTAEPVAEADVAAAAAATRARALALALALRKPVTKTERERR